MEFSPDRPLYRAHDISIHSLAALTVALTLGLPRCGKVDCGKTDPARRRHAGGRGIASFRAPSDGHWLQRGKKPQRRYLWKVAAQHAARNAWQPEEPVGLEALSELAAFNLPARGQSGANAICDGKPTAPPESLWAYLR